MDLKSLFFRVEGRIGRKTYWLSLLALAGIFLLALLGLYGVGIVALSFHPTSVPGAHYFAAGVTVLLIVVYLWAATALQVKRWHDRDKSGWWALIAFVPYLGSLWVFVECGCLPGTEGPNRFGDDPLRPSSAAPKVNW